ncbi:MAG TPA: glycoside hydrolase domain-containing protein [Armatimonadota bacterium]|nr:glycoside hydrolase domain-containing protein [Armatimonadota bacterium]
MMALPLRSRAVPRRCSAWWPAAALAVVAAGFTGLPALLAPAAAPSVWACGESLKVSPTLPPQQRNSVWTADGRLVRLYGARQEYVAFQVVPRAADGPLTNVEVTVGPLKSAGGQQLAAENIDLFREHYLKVTVPSQHDNVTPVPEGGAGEYPTQMVPLRAPRAAFEVPAGRNQPVWVDLYIPEGQAPGDYRGEVQVTAAGKPLATLNLLLTVWDFTLPRETHLKTYLPTGPEKIRWAFGLEPSQEGELSRLLDRFFQMAHQHRLNFFPQIEDDALAEWDGPYRPYLDGSAFRERAGQGVGQNLVVVGTGGETQGDVSAYAKHVLDWWKRRGKKPDLAVYLYDEPQEEEEFQAAADRARWIRGAVGKELPLFLTTMRPGKVPPGLVDIWGEVPADQIPARQKNGEKFWATNQGYAGGPYTDTPGYSGRSQAWMAWKMGLDAWQFWDCCYWVDRQNLRDPAGKRLTMRTLNSSPKAFLTDTWNDPLTFDQKRNPRMRDWTRLNGDGCLFYPGTPAGLREPLSSFTMKSLRRGLQDYEYLWLLKQKGESPQAVVDRLVPKPNQWSRDPNAWDEARIELGKRLASR